MMASSAALAPHDLNQLSASTRSELERGGRMLIDGEFVDAPSKLPVIDPSSGKTVSEICDASPADVDAAVRAARRAFESGPWRNTPPAEREKLLWRLAESIEEHADLLSELESVDVGMPRWMSRNLDVAGTAGVVRYMAGWPTKIGGRTTDVAVPIPGSEFVGFTTKEPIGVVGAIIPWNVPLMLAVWKLAPALAAGCTIVLKPSEEACLSVLALARLVMQVGIPPGVVNVVTGGASAGEALVSHPDIDKITFTGSTATGRRIAEVAARKSKKLTLELGGKSPQLREAALHRHDAAALRRLEERLATMQSLIKARKLESYLEHHRKFHFGIYAMSGIPLLVETIENMWLRCGPVLSFVIPEYVVLLKGWDHHTAALKAIIGGDADRAESELVADITEAAHYLGGLADSTGQLRRPSS
jgi:hypothetical protein